MEMFYLYAGALVVISLLMLAPSLFNRKTVKNVDLEKQNLEITRQRLEQFSSDEARQELEAALLDDLKAPDYTLEDNKPSGIRTAVIVLCSVPVAAFVLYGLLGNNQWQHQVTLPSADQIEQNPAASLEVLLARLEQTLEQQPENADGWALAGRTYMSLGRYAEAEQAYATVHRLVGDDPDILTAWSDASLLVNGSQYTEEIAARLERALEMDPQQINALWIAGMGSRSIGDSASALGYLKRLRPLLTAQPEALEQINQVIAQIDDSSSSVDVAQDNQATDTAVVTPASISVTVSLDPDLQTLTTPTDKVFVFARAQSGPPFPLAATRLSVADLPTDVVLNDSMAMIEGRNLSSTAQVLVTARISKSGTPTASPGDLTSDPQQVPTQNSPAISLSINQVVK